MDYRVLIDSPENDGYTLIVQGVNDIHGFVKPVREGLSYGGLLHAVRDAAREYHPIVGVNYVTRAKERLNGKHLRIEEMIKNA